MANLRQMLQNTSKCKDCGADLLRVGKRHICDRKLIVAIPPTTYEYRNKGKRRKYQRELMKQVRARRKALKAKDNQSVAAPLPPIS